MEPCKSYRQGQSCCADGFPQCGYCWNGKVGRYYNKPLCLDDNPPDHKMETFLDKKGKPKMFEKEIEHD